MEKVLIPLYDNEVAPRFDHATDVLEVTLYYSQPSRQQDEKVLVLARASADELARFVVAEKIDTVICAGIEKRYHQFLKWKGINVIADVCGPVDAVLDAYIGGTLKDGAVLYGRKEGQYSL